MNTICRVCHLAGVFIKHLKQRSNPEGLTDQEVLCVRLAGLCHDLGESSCRKFCLKYIFYANLYM